ncbi:MAG: hypothetical protein HC821_04310 [Lewinella sp.]|nr:hypothetical protein [Lewinella sp.]
MNNFFLAFISAFLLLGLGCNPAEAEPVYLLIEGVELRTNEAQQGAATQDVTEAWVFVNNVLLGVFDLPARVPVLADGEAEIRVEMGVRENGLSQLPNIFPFYAPYETNLTLVAGQTYALGILPFGYRSTTVFGIIEDFENNRPRIFTDLLTGNSSLRISNSNPRSGSNCGQLTLDLSNPVAEITSLLNFLPQGLTPEYWLEVDVLADVPVVWGLVGFDGQGALGRYLALAHGPMANGPNSISTSLIYLTFLTSTPSASAFRPTSKKMELTAGR